MGTVKLLKCKNCLELQTEIMRLEKLLKPLLALEAAGIEIWPGYAKAKKEWREYYRLCSRNNIQRE